MDPLFKTNYSVKEIKNIENDIKKTFSKWLLNIKSQSTINPDVLLESYIYSLEKFNYVIGIIHFLHQWKFKTPIKHRLGVKIWL